MKNADRHDLSIQLLLYSLALRMSISLHTLNKVIARY